MKTVSLEFPEEVFSALRLAPDQFGAELRMAAAIYWYQRRLVSGSKAAQIAGTSRLDFLDELARRRIDVVQIDVDELRRELARG